MRLGAFQDSADGAFDDRLARLDAALATACAEGDEPLDLVLCPELFTTGYGPSAEVAAYDEATATAAPSPATPSARCRSSRWRACSSPGRRRPWSPGRAASSASWSASTSSSPRTSAPPRAPAPS